VSPDRRLDKKIRHDALRGVYESDMLEWYRQQYNLSLTDEKYLRVSSEEASLDFYRRQFYMEIQFGVRKWGDVDPEFKMPPLPMLKQFGGVLPSPNGYGYDDDDTVDEKRLHKEVAERESARPRVSTSRPSRSGGSTERSPSTSQETERRTSRTTGPSEYIEASPNLPPHLTQEIVKTGSNMVRTEDAEYGMDDDEFWRFVELVERIDAEAALRSNQGKEWEVVESLTPESRKSSSD
jgi:hypothetical protein